MEKCKFCQEELAEGSTVCPHCGKDNAPETETVTPAEEVTEETTVVEETADEKTETEAPVEEETAETTEQPAAEEATEETPASPMTKNGPAMMEPPSNRRLPSIPSSLASSFATMRVPSRWQ